MENLERNKKDLEKIAEEYIKELDIYHFRSYEIIKKVLELEDLPDGPDIVTPDLSNYFVSAFQMLVMQYDHVVEGGKKKEFWQKVRELEAAQGQDGVILSKEELDEICRLKYIQKNLSTRENSKGNSEKLTGR